MRINIYSQELTKEVALVSATADTGITYYGIRMVLASPDILHHTQEDDDRSAVTFWIPNAARFRPRDFAAVLRHMAELVDSTAEDVPPNA